MTDGARGTAAGEAGEATAREIDAADPLAILRQRFRLPVDRDGRPLAYLAGNSLGPQPTASREAVLAVLDRWAGRAVDGWFARDGGWLDMERAWAEATGRIVGARPVEVTTANSLSVNLHLLLAAFYRPSGRRTAILVDAPTFPSDRYVVDSQLRHHGLDPERHRIVVRPRAGEAAVRPDDLAAAIHEHRDRLAAALLAGVNHATGQALDVPALTGAIHEAGGVALWDLAHAAGNVELALHDAGVDGAAWCTYKYLNAGPGAPAQLFLHERHHGRVPPLAGWWGNEPATRFRMAERFEPAPGADGYRVSTPPVLSLVPVGVGLALIDEVGMPVLRRRSVALTGYLEALLDALVPDVTLLTPRDPAARGAQLSLRVTGAAARHRAIEARGVVGDVREPDIVRLAPAPLFNSFHDGWRAATALAATAVD
ncbi:MAG: kynureninase [Candidatus Limnocylindria bacterium]